MRCLSVQQPWAWTICTGFKRIENRTWQTPYRGPVAIVASGKRTEANRAVAEFTGKLPSGTLAYSAIIGTVTLSDVVPLSEDVEDDPHAFGPYCWVLTEPKLFQTPIQTKPKLQLYNPAPGEVVQIASESARSGLSVANPVLAAFAKSLEMAPYSRLCELANRYRISDQMDAIERLATRLLVAEPSQPGGYFFRAFVALVDERNADALADLDQAISLDPSHALSHLLRSEAHGRLGNSQAADADCNRALALDSNLVHGWVNVVGESDE